MIARQGFAVDLNIKSYGTGRRHQFGDERSWDTLAPTVKSARGTFQGQ